MLDEKVIYKTTVFDHYDRLSALSQDDGEMLIWRTLRRDNKDLVSYLKGLGVRLTAHFVRDAGTFETVIVVTASGISDEDETFMKLKFPTIDNQ